MKNYSEIPIDELLRCLKNDWHISASWDGLRKFWCIELTEEGVKLRDATHGTLTAEQVREAVLENFEETHETYYDHWEPSKFDWQAIADELNDMLGSDDEYEAKMDELLCYLTNGKFSKSRQYSLDFMKAFVDEEYEDAYNELNAELGSGVCKNIAPEYLDFLCSECGFVHYHSDENDSGNGNDWAFCPQCGKAVKR